MTKVATLAVLAVLLAGSAVAEVKSRGETGFVVAHEVEVAIGPDAAYGRFLEIGTWWSGEHSFSGDATNMSISPQPGGCWCETLTGGGFVRHMDVAFAEPGKTLVFRGGLGPLLFMGAQASMTVTFEAAGSGSKVILAFAAGGYDPAGFAKLPDAVDGVLGEQMARFKTSAGSAP